MKKEEIIPIRVDLEFKKRIQTLAENEHRTLSDYIRVRLYLIVKEEERIQEQKKKLDEVFGKKKE